MLLFVQYKVYIQPWNLFFNENVITKTRLRGYVRTVYTDVTLCVVCSSMKRAVKPAGLQAGRGRLTTRSIHSDPVPNTTENNFIIALERFNIQLHSKLAY